MDGRWIKNWSELAVSENRISAMRIVESGLDSIDTHQVILNSLKIDGQILTVKDREYDLSKFKHIKVIGFGKASCDAAQALEKVLGSKIMEGVVIGLNKKICEYIDTYNGTHPRPSPENAGVGKKIIEMISDGGEDDLVIVVVSGGGSALLCYPELECEQGLRLYDASIKKAMTISELNTVRKHISGLKGGGLAKLLYPATVISLIFSDVPGDKFSDVASGPTYKDETTIMDAKAIIDKFDLGNFELNETPKEDKYFERVNNIILVSNKTAVDAMSKKANELGFSFKIVSYDIYDPIENVVGRFVSESKNNVTILGAGEPKMTIKDRGGSGGRNLFLGMLAVGKLPPSSVFVSLASDGLDNSSGAGAIVDNLTEQKLFSSVINVQEYISRYDAYVFFEKLKDSMIVTGPTGANVSDLMFLISRDDKN